LAFGQATPLLTWGEIYNYEVGDTFIRAQMWDQPPVTFTRAIVTSKSFSADGDTVSYGVDIRREMNYMGGQPACCITLVQGPETWVYTNLDDTALQHISQLNPHNYPDTALIQTDSSYTGNGILYNRAHMNFQTSNCTTVYEYAAGLGDTYYDWLCPIDGYKVWMEYYHKKNGAMAGQPREFLTGVKELTDNIQVVISPNPVKENFQLQLSETPAPQTYLHLYDALGREVGKEPVLSSQNTLRRNGLAAGIYFWQLENSGNILNQGKLTFN
jgi:hypothetical protein